MNLIRDCHTQFLASVQIECGSDSLTVVQSSSSVWHHIIATGSLWKCCNYKRPITNQTGWTKKQILAGSLNVWQVAEFHSAKVFYEIQGRLVTEDSITLFLKLLITLRTHARTCTQVHKGKKKTTFIYPTVGKFALLHISPLWDKYSVCVCGVLQVCVWGCKCVVYVCTHWQTFVLDPTDLHSLFIIMTELLTLGLHDQV